MSLLRLCCYFLGFGIGAVHAQTLVPLIDLLPECKQSEVVPIKTIVKVRKQNLERASALRDVPEIARYLQQIRENATARRFDGVMVQKLKQSEHHLPGSFSEVYVHLELFRFCEGNDALSDKSADVSARRAVKLDFGALKINTVIQTTIVPPEPDYQVIPPANMNVSLQQGAMGVKLNMTAEQVLAQWGSPSADLTLQDGSRLLGYGRRLWVLLNPVVKVVFTDGEILSGVGRNMLEFHPEFDDKRWLVEGKVAYKTDLVQAALQLGAWHKTTPLQWRKQQPGQQLRLTFDEYNPGSVHNTTAILTGFRLSHAADKPVNVVLKQQPLEDILNFAESVSVRHLHRQPAAALFAPQLRVNHLVQRRNLGWWLPMEQLHVLLNKDYISRLKVTTSVLRTPGQADQLPALLRALQIPISKAGLRLAFPDIQDFGDRFQLYRDDYDILIEFNSDEEQAGIEQLEIIYHFTER